MSTPIAIVGMGVRFARSPNLSSFWRNIRAAEPCYAPAPEDRWRHESFFADSPRKLDRYYARAFGVVDGAFDFSPETYGIQPRRAKLMDPQQRHFLDVCRMAFEDAGYPAARGLPRETTGVFAGVSVSEHKAYATLRERTRQVLDGQFGRVPDGLDELFGVLSEAAPSMSAYSMVGQMHNMAAANVSYVYDLQGPAMSTDAACSAALVALNEGVSALRNGQCDAAVVGGTYFFVTPDNVIAFSRIGALSRASRCNPFDESADGFVLGEGAGAFVLKRLDDALAAGDRIWSVIRGVGVSNDGKADGPMTPRLAGQLACLERAYADAGVDPATIEYLEAHGTGTKVGDLVEATSMKQFFGAHEARAPRAVGGVKATVGHAISAAGAASVAKAALVVDRAIIPRQTNFGTPRTELGLEGAGFSVPTAERRFDADVRRAGVSAFGFGGTNVHVVLEQAPGARAPQVAVPAALDDLAPLAGVGGATADRPELFVVSAPEPELLATHLEDLAADLEARAGDELAPSLRQVAAALAQRAGAPGRARVAFVAGTRDELLSQLREAAGVARDGSPSARVAFGAPGEAARLGFLFPGQGAQRLGLARDLYERYPRFARALDRLAGAVDTLGSLDRPLLSYLFAQGEEAALDLEQTEVCQPALAAVELALVEFLADVGVEPALCIGHSLGEFAAVAASGAARSDAMVALVARRGRIMADLELRDPGAMAAVALDRATLVRHVEGRAGISIANVNHPRQTVVSGPSDAVTSLVDDLVAQDIQAKRLPVSHGFHSPLMDPVARAMRAELDRLPLTAPRSSAVSCIDVGPYPADADAARDILVRHATSPVDFAGAVRSAADQVDAWVQVGAGTAFLTMARAAAPDADADGTALLAASPDDGRTFLRALGHLFCAGVDADLRSVVTADAADAASDGRTDLPPTPVPARRLHMLKQKSNPSPLPAVRVGAPADASAPATSARATSAPATTAPATTAPATDGQATTAPGRVPAEVLEIVREQNRLLAEQTRILSQQTEMLLRFAGTPATTAKQPGAAFVAPAATTATAHTVAVGPTDDSPAATDATAAPPSPSAAPAAPAAPPAAAAMPAAASTTPAADSNAANAALATTDGTDGLSARVTSVVSRVSAFPVDSLSLGQSLLDDLGFDSLMAVELSAALSKEFPTVAEVPRELFASGATIGDLVEFVGQSSGNATGTPASAQTSASDADDDGRASDAPAVTPGPSPVRYRVEYREQAAPSVHDDGHALVGSRLVVVCPEAPETEALAREVVSRVRSRGAEAIVSRGDAVQLRDSDTVLDLRALAGGRSAGEDDARRFATGFNDVRDLVRARQPRRLLLVHAASAPGLGGLGGLAKALDREWHDTAVGALAVGAETTGPLLADLLAADVLGGSTGGDVRYLGGRRERAVLVPEAPTGSPSLAPRPVVVVSGGGGGIGARVARALAARASARLVLLGRRERDGRIDELLGAIEADGGRAHYAACDVRDADAVARAVAAGREAFGPITAVVHAAGVLADGPFADKTTSDLDAVYATKVDGARSLLAATDCDPVRAFVGLGSWAGRFGNAHQTVYSAANHALARLAEDATRSDRRVVALALPPWEGTDMAASIPAAVADQMKRRGVTFLDDATGTEAILTELASAAPGGELVVGADLDAASVGLELRFRVAPDEPVVADHRLGSAGVVPMAFAVDLMLRAARAAGLRGSMSLCDLNIRQAIRVAEPVIITARATGSAAADGTPGDLTLELFVNDAARAAYRAVARAADGPLAAIGDAHLGGAPVPAPSVGDFYDHYSFHGASLRGLERVVTVAEGGARGALRGAPGRFGARCVDVVALDSALQLCGLHARAVHDRYALPTGFDELRLVVSDADADASANADQGPLDCTCAGDRSGSLLRGDIDVTDGTGRALVQVRGQRAELLDRLPGQAAPRASNGAALRPVNGSSAPTAERSSNGALAPSNSAHAAGVNGHAADEVRQPVTGQHAAVDSYEVAHFPEVKELRGRLDMARAAGLEIPYFNVHERVTNETSLIDGREFLNFSSYNYLGLSGHPEVNAAAAAAIERYGTSVSASRVASGEKPLHRQLEQSIAEFVGCEDTLVMVGGHATNVSVIGHMLDHRDLVLHDSLAHDSILGGVALSGARRRPFPHNDLDKLDSLLTQLRPHARRVLVAVEGVYSMDGDTAPLAELIEIKNRHGALLYVDEAHSIGAVGRTGRGIGELCDVDKSQVDLWMGTLSKAFASCGGYIGGSTELIEYLKYTNPGFVYSVGISPANAAAALASIDVLRRQPELVETLQARSRFFLAACRERGIDTGSAEPGTPVVPAIVPNSMDCMRLAQALNRRSINVQPILYPAVEDNQARLRFFVTARHSEAQLLATADAVAEELVRINPAHLRSVGPTDDDALPSPRDAAV